MNRNILSLFVSLAVVSSTLLSVKVSAQSVANSPEAISNGEKGEKVGTMWEQITESVLIKHHPSNEDFKTFLNFEDAKITALKLDFFKNVRAVDIEPVKTQQLIKSAESSLSSLFQVFEATKKDYPSSVAQYTGKNFFTTNPCDSSGVCTNIDFNTGDFSGWYGYYAAHGYDCSVSTISGITGGSLGAVTEACQDPTTMNYMNTNYHLGLTTDYQLSITSSGFDNIINTIPRVSPWATGGHSVMLGDSTFVGYGTAILEKTFLVAPGTANVTYQYALFLQNPSGHCYGNQPSFVVAVLDENGDTIPTCGTYNVTSGYGTSNFDSTTYGGQKLYYRNWTIVNVPLKHYVGQCVTIVFEVRDCGQGGHFGYAYVDASCSPLVPISSSPGFCGQDSIELTGPPGAQTYEWSGPDSGSIRGDTSKQIVWVDSMGTYTLVTIPVTGAQCADTMTITLGKAQGPPPHPSFKADTVCAGHPTTFINTSTPNTGKFWWDFYDIGVYNLNDTNNFNPTWTYVTPGIYHVKIHEVYNGCGTDSVLTVVVDTVPTARFTASGGCVNSSITFSNSSIAGNQYSWNFGDPLSAPNDTSTLISPAHTYTAAGTYTVTLINKNAGGCDDTDKVPITIYSIPNPVITGPDSVCPGAHVTLTVSGGSTYIWTVNSSTKDSISGNPTVTTTYTVEAFNGTCEQDATFTVNIKPGPIVFATASKDSVCSGDTLTLWASGGSKYTWLPSLSTNPTIHVSQTTVTTYTLVGHGVGSLCNDSVPITIGILKPITASVNQSTDSICPGEYVLLNAIVGGSAPLRYKWSPGGETSASISVSPTVTTTYTSTVVGKCDSITNTLKVVVDPLPATKITGTSWKCLGIRDTLYVSGATSYLWSNGKTATNTSPSNRYITGLINADSVVTVIGYNALGCSDTMRFLITLRPKPAVTITPPGTACAGQDVLLSANGSGIGPFTYKWSDGTTTVLSTYDTVTVNPTVPTTYIVTVSNGCTNQKSTTVFPDNPPLVPCCEKTIVKGDDTVLFVEQGYTKLPYTWLPSAGVTCLDPNCDTVKVSPTVTTTYTVEMTDTLGCVISRIVTITVETPCFNFTVPNVFSPNGDGIDEQFVINTKNIDGWSIVIFDRWGKEMFKTTNQYVYWDGNTEAGAKASTGVYYYIITGTCQGTTYKKDGFLQLIR